MTNTNRSRQYIQRIIDQHQQISNVTCIPSAVEMVLKLLGKVETDYCDLQNRWTIGSFANFDGQTVSGVTFQRINLAERSPTFPFDQLFRIIDQELASDRYVIVSLFGMSSEGPSFHAYVIFDEDRVHNDYFAVTKASLNGRYVTQFDENIKERVRRIQGTDILVYTLTSTQDGTEEHGRKEEEEKKN